MVLRAARIETAPLTLLLQLDEGHRHVVLGAHGGRRMTAAGGGGAPIRPWAELQWAEPRRGLVRAVTAMQPPEEAGGWDGKEEAEYDDVDGGDGSDEEEEEAERIIEIIDRRLKRPGGAQADFSAAPVEELLVKRQGYAKAVWMDSGSLLESGRLSVSMLRAFERKQKVANDQANRTSLTAHAKAPAAKAKPKQTKDKRGKPAAGAQADGTVSHNAPAPHPLDDHTLVILYPQREADFDEDSLRMELEENVALRNQLCKHLHCSRIQDLVVTTARGTHTRKLTLETQPRDKLQLPVLTITLHSYLRAPRTSTDASRAEVSKQVASTATVTP